MKKIYFNSFTIILMPEIWLGYGSTHVVLDIKQENLLQFKSEVNLMSDENIRSILTDIMLAKNSSFSIIFFKIPFKNYISFDRY
jgi:hypothetical protein